MGLTSTPAQMPQMPRGAAAGRRAVGINQMSGGALAAASSVWTDGGAGGRLRHLEICPRLRCGTEVPQIQADAGSRCCSGDISVIHGQEVNMQMYSETLNFPFQFSFNISNPARAHFFFFSFFFH